MSNIRAIPLPVAKRFPVGGATAAEPIFPFPSHESLDKALPRMDAEDRRIMRDAHKLRWDGVCRACRGRSRQWKVGTCPGCNNTGAA